MHCNKVWSGGNTVLHNSVGDEGGERGAQTKGVFANTSIDSCTKAYNSTNILFRPTGPPAPVGRVKALELRFKSDGMPLLGVTTTLYLSIHIYIYTYPYI